MRTASLVPLARVLACALLVSACDGTVDAPDAASDATVEEDAGRVLERNACGGSAALDAAPGETCGPCDRGLVVCEGADATRCLGEGALDACGGCDVLPGAPGDACGVCDDGALACGEDGLACEDAAASNACGG